LRINRVAPRFIICNYRLLRVRIFKKKKMRRLWKLERLIILVKNFNLKFYCRLKYIFFILRSVWKNWNLRETCLRRIVIFICHAYSSRNHFILTKSLFVLFMRNLTIYKIYTVNTNKFHNGSCWYPNSL